MEELGITKGEWMWDGDPTSYDPKEEAPWLITTKHDKILSGEINCHNRKDAELICDAGNTAQKCGLLPSELLRQRDELREALADMVSQFAYEGTKNNVAVMHTGGLSALEDAFVALGLSDPITVEDFEAAIKNTEG